MGCKSCMSGTRVFFLIILNVILMLVSLCYGAIAAYYTYEIINNFEVVSITLCSMAGATFLITFMFICNGYASKCFLYLYNIILTLVTLVEGFILASFYMPQTAESAYNIANFPKIVTDFLDNYSFYVVIGMSTILCIQVISVIFAGFHINDMNAQQIERCKKHTITSGAESPLIHESYASKAQKNYGLDKYFNKSSSSEVNYDKPSTTI
ncbi:hypothetical protein WA158_004906 [Blastocystis sp. Blastoise]